MQSDLLCTLIRGVDPPQSPGCGLGWGIATAGEGTLFPEEAVTVARAVPHRVAEFTAGRMAARRALAELGLPAVPIPAGPDRAPIWPEGLIGSISHVNGLCLAVVARAEAFHTLGVDLEGDAPLEADLIPAICRPEELAHLPDEAHAAHAKRLFSAKEAAYKAHYPRARLIYGFHSLSVDLTEGRARFTDHPEIVSLSPDSRIDLPLRQVVGGGLILSLSVTPRPAVGT